MIRNSEELGTTTLRRDALSIAEAGIRAALPDEALRASVALEGEVLLIRGRRFDLSRFRRVYLVGFGKASLAAASFFESLLGARIADGVVIDTVPGALRFVRCFVGTHPVPSARNVAATRKIVKLLEAASRDDLVLVLVSGGGSALLADPAIPLSDYRRVFSDLLASGAEIRAMNAVRKHLSRVHGGQLAHLAFPARVASLIFSDAPGARPSVVASGPTYRDSSRASDAAKILRRLGIAPVPLVETPKEARYFSRVSNIVVLDNAVALEAMAGKACSLGYAPRILSRSFRGEARRAGARLLSALGGAGSAVIAGGETTVVVRGRGVGGRNQEVVLGALEAVPPQTLLLSIGSDGRDAETEFAGALGDSALAECARSRGVAPRDFLEANDSYRFFADLGGGIRTGPTGTNVSDLFLALRARSS